MKVLYGPDFYINESAAIAIGKFDGLHIGHKRVLTELISHAKSNNLKSVVYTFMKNPKLVLHQEEFIPLMTNEEKTDEISKFDIDYLVYEDFNENFSNMEPEEFVKKILVDKLLVKLVVMGENSTFGKNKLGNIGTMKKLGEKYGFKVICVNMILDNGKIISSSSLREHKFSEKY